MVLLFPGFWWIEAIYATDYLYFNVGYQVPVIHFALAKYQHYKGMKCAKSTKF